MNWLKQIKHLNLLCIFTLFPLATSVPADPIIRAGNNVSYIISNEEPYHYTYGFGRATRDQMFKNFGSTTSPSNFTKATKFSAGISNNVSCIGCHPIQKGQYNKDISSSKLMSHTLLLGPANTSKVLGHGDNTYGQLGNELSPNLLSCHDIQNFCLSQNAIGIAAGSWSSYVIQTDGTVKACGENLYGKLGDGTTTTRKELVFVKVNANTNLTNIRTVYAGNRHTLFIDNNNILWGCGSNAYGQLGLPSPSNQLFAVQVATGVTKVEAGAYHTIILTTNGDIYTTGQGTYGQLATGSTANKFGWGNAVNTSCTDIAAGAYFSVCLKSDKKVYTSGDNTQGQLGNGNTTNQLNWVQTNTNIDLITAGKDHTLLWRRSDNTYWTSGNNVYGQCGTGTYNNFYTTWQSVQFE